MNWSLGAGLEGRGVLVAGAAGGIGRRVAFAFASVGARVMAVDLDRVAVEEVVAGLDGSGHAAVSMNLADVSSHDALLAEARRKLGSVHALVNLASVLRRQSDLQATTESDWDHQHSVNLKAAFFLCRAASRVMIDQRKGGRIVNFASQAWWTGGFGGSLVYAASKGGVVSLTRGLARSLGPHGITVNCVAPGFVSTPMLMTDLSPEAYGDLAKQIPLGYVAEPEHVAGAVVFLASDHASYITGVTINVSGGFLMY